MYHQCQARVVKEHIKKKNNFINNAAALRTQFSPLLQCAFKTFAYIYMKQTSTPFLSTSAQLESFLEQQTKAAGFWAATQDTRSNITEITKLKETFFLGGKRKHLQQNKGA